MSWIGNVFDSAAWTGRKSEDKEMAEAKAKKVNEELKAADPALGYKVSATTEDHIAVLKSSGADAAGRLGAQIGEALAGTPDRFVWHRYDGIDAYRKERRVVAIQTLNKCKAIAAALDELHLDRRSRPLEPWEGEWLHSCEVLLTKAKLETAA